MNNTQHGEYSITTLNNVLIASISGGWNEIAALNFKQDFIDAASLFNKKPWAHLVYLDEWELAVPEVEPIITSLVQWCVENNMTHVAQVYRPSMLKKYQINDMVDSTAGHLKRAFSNDSDAKKWLEKSGFRLAK